MAGRYQNVSFNPNGYNQSYSKAPYNRNYRSNKKKSGARMFNISEGKNKGKFGVSAWNVSKKRGFITLTAFPMTSSQLSAYSKNRGWKDHKPETTSRSGRVYERWTYTLTNKTSGQVANGVAFYDKQNRKLYVPRFGMVASISRNYFGSSRRPQNGR